MKKNKIFLLGMLVVLLTFGLTILGCGDGAGTDPDPNSNSNPDPDPDPDLAFAGTTVTKTDIDVYNAGGNLIESDNHTFTKYNLGGSPAALISIGLSNFGITSGKLSLTLGTPTSGTMSVTGPNLTITPADLAILPILHFDTADESKHLYYAKDNVNFVYYIYANKDGTIKGTADGSRYYNLNLKAGWNTAFYNDSNKQTITGTPGANYLWRLINN